MYADFYRLRHEPFNITPDPRFLFLTPQHQEALNHLLYGIRQRKGFICLTGEVGAGKTTLCRALLDQLDASFRTALILNPVLSETQLLRAICDEFALPPAGRRDRLSCLNQLNAHLIEANAAGQTAVLVIDECQDMPDATLEMTRLLSNLETPSQKLLQIVLVGQPELRAKLAKPALRQLSQRITVRFHLGNMDAAQTADYVRHRLTVAAHADAEPVQFDDDALGDVFAYAGGTPRLVNAICDKCLLAGYVYQSRRIGRQTVRLAAEELHLQLKEAS